jgi:RES domain-containing protein
VGPIFEPELLDALEATVRPFHGPVWRSVIGDSDPLRPNMRGARWNPPGVEALYFPLDGQGALTEVAAVIARQPVPIRRPLRLYRFRVALHRTADLRDEAPASVGYPHEALVGEDWAEPSHAGAAANWLGLSGLLVPSARHHGSNLVVLVGNLGPTERLELNRVV